MARWSKFNDTHNTSEARNGSRNYDNGSSGRHSAFRPHEDNHISERDQDTHHHRGRRRDPKEVSHHRSSYNSSERRDARPSSSSKRSECSGKTPRRDLVRMPSRSPSPRNAKRLKASSSARNTTSINHGSQSPTQRDACVDGSRKSLSGHSSIVSPSIDLLEPPAHSQRLESPSSEQEQQNLGIHTDLEASTLETPTKCSHSSSVPSPRNGDKRPNISTNAVRKEPTVQGIRNSKASSSASVPAPAHQLNNQSSKKSHDSPKSPRVLPKNIAKSSASTDPVRPSSSVQSLIEKRSSDTSDPKIMASQPEKSPGEDFQSASGKELEINHKKTSLPSIMSGTKQSWNALIEPVVNLIHSHFFRDQLRRQVEKATQVLEKHISRYPEVRAQSDLPRHQVSVLQKQLSDAEVKVQSCSSALEDLFPLFQQLCQELMPSESSSAPSPLPASSPSLVLLEEKFEKKFQDQKTILDRQESLLRSYEKREREHQHRTKKLEERITRMEESRQAASTSNENSNSAGNVSRQIQDAIKAERNNINSIVGQIDANNRKLLDAFYDSIYRNISQSYVTQQYFQNNMSKLETALNKVETDVRFVETSNYKRENNVNSLIDETGFRKLQKDTCMCQNLISSHQKTTDENTAAVTKELREVQLNLTQCLSNMAQLESANSELQLEHKLIKDSLASLESKASNASSMANEAHTQLDTSKKSIMKELENVQTTLAGSLEACETRLTEIQEKQITFAESMAETTERLSEIHKKQSMDSAQLAVNSANLKSEVDAGLDRKSLKSVMKKMKNLEEIQNFVVKSWGSQLDDLREEIPNIIEGKLSEHKAAVQQEIRDGLERMSKSEEAENGGNSSDNKQAPNQAAAPDNSKTVVQGESQVGNIHDARSCDANPTAAAIGPVSNINMKKVDLILESFTETKARMVALESSLESLTLAFETIQAQYQNLRAGDVYESIVEHLEFWHPSSTRTIIDELRLRVNETNNKLEELLAMDRGSSKADMNGVVTKKRHFDGSAVMTGGITH